METLCFVFTIGMTAAAAGNAFRMTGKYGEDSSPSAQNDRILKVHSRRGTTYAEGVILSETQ